MKNGVSFECQNVQVEIPEDDIINYIRSTFHPGDIFPEHELIQWAEDNGYAKV